MVLPVSDVGPLRPAGAGRDAVLRSDQGGGFLLLPQAQGDVPGETEGDGMRYLSLCSGIEAASVAWDPLGWEPVAFAEIEAFPSAVLKAHYPDVPNLGDITKFMEWPDLGTVDLVCGGTPCQSFSVAGLRRGLDDPRGDLMLTYLAIV